MQTQYTIVVRGRLGARWAEEFGALEVHARPDGTTALTGPVRDQCELHGALRRIESLGLTLVSISEIGADR